MRVGIVGAGMAGLACALHLQERSIETVVFEKAPSAGGRISTQAKNGYIWDNGATSIAPRGKKIERFLLEDRFAGERVLIDHPIGVHDGRRMSRGSSDRNKTPRYCFVSGNTVFPKGLAERLDVRYAVNVEEVVARDGLYWIGEESFDRLVLATTIPQAHRLLSLIKETRPISSVSYRACISVQLGFEVPTPPLAYHALIEPEQVHPLTWLCLESIKSPGRAPEGCSAVVAQLSARFSKDNFDRPDEFLVETATTLVRQLLGPKFAHPSEWGVKKWRLSQPENIARFEAVNLPGSRVFVASDGLLGGRTEDAFQCGAMVAEMIGA